MIFYLLMKLQLLEFDESKTSSEKESSSEKQETDSNPTKKDDWEGFYKDFCN